MAAVHVLGGKVGWPELDVIFVRMAKAADHEEGAVRGTYE